MRLPSSLPAVLLAASAWLCLSTSNTKAATITLFQQWIDLSSVPEFSVPDVYVAKFGMFTNGFLPTLQNLSSWDSNFAGGTGTYNSGTNSPYVTFDNTDNATIPVGESLWLVVYNIAPGAQLSTATVGIIIGWQNIWVAGDALQMVEGRRGSIVETHYNFVYYAGGSASWKTSANYDENNYIPPSSADGVVSPTHTFSYNGNLVIGEAISPPSSEPLAGQAVPEPTSALLSALGATMLLRRRR